MVAIRRITEADIAGFCAAVDMVAREKRFLARLEGPSLEAGGAFVRRNLTVGNPQFIADDSGAIIGWCDIVRQDTLPIYCHIGVLGMGLVPAARGRGLGQRLIEAALEAAFAAGMLRIALTVRSDNLPAIRLYERAGFVHEGVHRATDRIDNVCHDTLSMALVR